MAGTEFSDLAFLWPFANELDKTLLVYMEQDPTGAMRRRGEIPPNDELAKSALLTALGRLVMDDSQPRFHLAGHRDQEYHQAKAASHLIYIGGSIRQEDAPSRDFLEKCDDLEYSRTVKLPDSAEAPRVLTIGEHALCTEYHGDIADHKCKVDYGLAYLAPNPFDGSRRNWSALAVAGCHSYGTLAAAMVVSNPRLSPVALDPIMANLHLPPHLACPVEIVVRASVDPEGRLDPLDADAIGAVIVRGRVLWAARWFPAPTSPRPATFGLPHGAIVNRDDDLRVSFTAGKKDSVIATPGTDRNDYKLPLHKEFFGLFRRKAVIVISPHSDDAGLGCGGLIYYLRNRSLWMTFHQEPPPVFVTVLTASARGVTEDHARSYAELIDKPYHAGLHTVIRHNESMAEGYALATDVSWLELDRLKQESEKASRILDELRTIGGLLAVVGREPLFIVPSPRDLHETHRRMTSMVLDILRRRRQNALRDIDLFQQSQLDVWIYESPWGPIEKDDVNVVVPLDRHAMFAKCQAIAMHRSQEKRTRFCTVALTRALHNAQTVGELVIAGTGGSSPDWQYLEAFQRRLVDIENFLEG